MKSKTMHRYGYIDLTRIIEKKCKPINNDKPKQDDTKGESKRVSI